MNRTVGIAALMSLLVAVPAWALRGVQPGATCKQAGQVEGKLGSRSRGSSSGNDEHLFFDGSYRGQDAVIAYNCQAGIVVSQLITIKFAHPEDARSTFADFKRALVADHGQPYKDADEPTISEMQKDSEQLGLPVERFVVWVFGKRVITLSLSGQGTSWELVVRGP
jgi:hypothetical protein